LDKADNLFIVDRLNNRIRRVDAGSGIITTVGGNVDKATSGDGGAALHAALLEPNDIAFSHDSRFLYIADPSAHRVRAVDMRDHSIDTFAGAGAGAGAGEARKSGDGTAAHTAGVWGARAVAVATDGTVYIAQKQGCMVRAVHPLSGAIRHGAGTGEYGYAGDDGVMTEAVFDRPKELCMDDDGAILIVDTEVPAIRRIDLSTAIVTTVIGVAMVSTISPAMTCLLRHRLWPDRTALPLARMVPCTSVIRKITVCVRSVARFETGPIANTPTVRISAATACSGY
jgi:hypothetical protein